MRQACSLFQCQKQAATEVMNATQTHCTCTVPERMRQKVTFNVCRSLLATHLQAHSCRQNAVRSLRGQSREREEVRSREAACTAPSRATRATHIEARASHIEARHVDHVQRDGDGPGGGDGSAQCTCQGLEGIRASKQQGVRIERKEVCSGVCFHHIVFQW